MIEGDYSNFVKITRARRRFNYYCCLSSNLPSRKKELGVRIARAAQHTKAQKKFGHYAMTTGKC